MNSQSGTLPVTTAGGQNVHSQCVGSSVPVMNSGGVPNSGGSVPVGTQMNDKPSHIVHFVIIFFSFYLYTYIVQSYRYLRKSFAKRIFQNL